MIITGESAKGFIVVSLSTFAQVNRGELVSANDVTGDVVYKDTPDTTKTLTLGPHAIKIIEKYPR